MNKYYHEYEEDGAADAERAAEEEAERYERFIEEAEEEMYAEYCHERDTTITIPCTTEERDTAFRIAKRMMVDGDN